MHQRSKLILDHLNNDVFEKEEVIALSFLSAIAGESIFLLGAPGVAKSLVARRLRFAFSDCKSFEYLMNRFSTPDEIFGPVSIAKLKNEDKYERNTDKYLPSSNVIFLDEIWKAGSSIQNALLTIVNEKIYRNGDHETKVDIRAIISASNELPEQGQGLEALWDRFLVRYLVDGIQDAGNFNAMITNSLRSYDDTVDPSLKVTNEEYLLWSQRINEVEVPAEVLNVIHVVRQYLNELQKDSIYVSDRRWRKIVRLLRTSAFLNGRGAVDLMDCFLIAHCIWDKPGQLETVKDLVAKAIRQHGYSLSLNINAVRNEINEFLAEVESDTIESRIEVPKTELVVTNDKFYEILNYPNDYRFVDRDTFEKLSTSYQKLNLYNQAGNDFVSVQVRKENQASVNVHGQGVLQLRTHILRELQVTYRKPNPRLVREWDGIVVGIQQNIDQEVTKAENYQRKQLEYLNTNLFVDKHLSVNVRGNITRSVNELQQLRLEIEKIKHYYDTIE